VTLPPFAWQSLYLDVGWGVVCAALLLTLLEMGPARLRARRFDPVVALACMACMWLPSPWAPSFWLGMAFQYPSLMLVFLAGAQLLRLQRQAHGVHLPPVLPAVPAASLFVLGTVLYGGSFVWFPLDVYAFGYASPAAIVLATTLVALWAACDRANGLACAAIAATGLVHAATRLPSGNAWDAMLDPMLFVWAGAVTLMALRARRRRPAAALLATAAP